MKSIFKGRNRKRADLVLVILASQSIDAHVQRNRDGHLEIRVTDDAYRAAKSHLEQYDLENSSFLFRAQIKKISGSTFSSPSILVVIGLLGLIHFFAVKTGYHNQAVFQFGASSYFLRQGEAFRAITALFLHSDLSHLMGNMAGLLALASPLVRMTGYGSGLFILLSAGTVGNLIAGGLGQDLRLSIGASTAVMAAAGLLAARQIILPSNGAGLWPKRLVPLAGAATLVAMFSHGERTDVSAHFFGFGAGAGIGLLFFPLFSICAGPVMERICLTLTLGITISAILQGIQ